MQNRHNQPSQSSAAAANEARRRVKDDPDRLALESFRGGQLAHAGLIDGGLIWDALFVAATTAGVPHLQAQETIGRQFRLARAFPLLETEAAA